MVLAQNVSGTITGLDFFSGFIDKFNLDALKLNLQNRVKGIVGSMDNLPFEKESLDLIWSEGAIYNIGFERGINEWRDYLKSGGYIAVSEGSWFTEERPAEIHDFLDAGVSRDRYNSCQSRTNAEGWLSPRLLHLYCRKNAGRNITISL